MHSEILLSLDDEVLGEVFKEKIVDKLWTKLQSLSIIIYAYLYNMKMYVKVTLFINILILFLYIRKKYIIHQNQQK